ncbi:hypothetical protein RJ640_000674 [Escallonia rubra]|uniref:rhamnogalacturonan endolyase n=1 Tax=Escallonia rubra TaxID=112253 RepID=A0AA88QR50_9ASTE|nr:hypothetical protein RJ640_000674 [Escallonia rubra]
MKKGPNMFVDWLIFVLLLSVTACYAKNPSRWSPGTNSQGINSSPPVQLRRVDNDHVVMDNGLLNVTLSTPTGFVTAIQFNGMYNVLEYRNKESKRGYWDVVWSKPGSRANIFDVLPGTQYKVIAEDENRIEVSFIKTWNSSSLDNEIPLNIDKRFIMLRGSPGFYSYAIFEHFEGLPAVNIAESRMAFQLQQDWFHYMALSDARQKFMPSPWDRAAGKVLDYPEAVLLKNSADSSISDNRVSGWVSTKKSVGFWVIIPSDEFRAGGPVKQDLTSHVGPTTLAPFLTGHYAGNGLTLTLQDGEPWKKVFGPVFIYLNSGKPNNDPRTLWDDAKKQMLIETKSWPYDFPLSQDFPHANQRGTMSGRLLVRDRYISRVLINASSAHVGLAPPGEAGSWQRDTRGYQFWNQTDLEGNFMIRGVRPGTYNLYGWVPGFIGDYKCALPVNMSAGDDIQLGDIEYNPPSNGFTIWEIGIPDRTAAEFFVPNPRKTLMTYLSSSSSDRFRQYGLWDRYTDLYPKEDLVYTVGASNYSKDWFFAHVTRDLGNKTYVPTTWRIVFNLPKVVPTRNYTLQLALASATAARLQSLGTMSRDFLSKSSSYSILTIIHVMLTTFHQCYPKGWINDQNAKRPHFDTRLIGKDNSIARHGIHGLYWLYSFNVPGYQLHKGTNTIFLRQAFGSSPFFGVMYDYIRLEAP